MQRFLNLTILLILFLIGCGDQDPYTSDYTKRRPYFADVVGTYKFEQQTIRESTFKEDSAAFILLKADGNFEGHNIPALMSDVVPKGDSSKYVSTTGKWKIEIDSVDTGWGDKKACWGINVKFTSGNPLFMRFIGSSPPFKLIFNYDEPDFGYAIIFSKK
ncbi:MAG TPA: hypothetical protein VFE54_14510 [Mucilaginibacter sp.]|nr:hypothetical protein [Mucilaginibacter sp.]